MPLLHFCLSRLCCQQKCCHRNGKGIYVYFNAPVIDWLLVVRWVRLGLEGAQIMQIMYILNGIEEKEGDSCLSLCLRLHLCPTTEVRSEEIKFLHEEFLWWKNKCSRKSWSSERTMEEWRGVEWRQRCGNFLVLFMSWLQFWVIMSLVKSYFIMSITSSEDVYFLMHK